MMDTQLIIDIGTGSTRVALVSNELKIIAVKSFKNHYYVDSMYQDAKYFLPIELKDKIFLNIQELIKENSNCKIKYISSSAARESVVLIDSNGEEYYGLPNIDNRGEKWKKDVPNREYIEKYTGRPLTEDFVALKLYGFKKRGKLYEKLYKVISLSEWIGYIFSNKILMEYSQACETQLFNIYEKKWDEYICESFNLSIDILPKVVPTGAIYPIKTHIKEKLLIDESCMYVVGGADTQLAAQGMYLDDEDIGLISGTSSPVVKYENKIPDYETNKDFNFWCGYDLGGERYQIETNPGVTGLNLQLAKESILPEVSYGDIDSYIEKNYTNLKCIASFTTQSPYKNISFPHGGYLATVPFNQELSKYDLIHSIVADIAFAIAFKIRQNEVLSQTMSPYIVGSGGGLKMQSLCQMIADLTGKILILKDNFEEASIIGCARICLTKDSDISHKKIKIVSKYIPKKSEYLTNKMEEWLLYRERINSIKKEIGDF